MPGDSEHDTGITNALSQIDSIPLPPAVKKSLWKALGTLITGVVDWPAAWLESKSQAIRDETAARSLITAEAAKAAAKKFSSDEQLIARAVDHFGARILKEQKNREAVAQATLHELSSAPPEQDTTQEVDEDWLDMFSRVAEQRSNKEMQMYLAKLLAGEIRNPGSFDPATIELLAKLTPKMARTFQEFCNISMVVCSSDGVQIALDDDNPFVLAAPYGLPGQNALSDLGFSYTVLTKLQDIGLIQNDLNALKYMPESIFIFPIEIGGAIFQFAEQKILSQEQLKNIKGLNIINLTTSGIQLRKIVEKTPNQQYIDKLRSWLNSTYQWEKNNVDS